MNNLDYFARVLDDVGEGGLVCIPPFNERKNLGTNNWPLYPLKEFEGYFAMWVPVIGFDERNGCGYFCITENESSDVYTPFDSVRFWAEEEFHPWEGKTPNWDKDRAAHVLDCIFAELNGGFTRMAINGGTEVFYPFAIERGTFDWIVAKRDILTQKGFDGIFDSLMDFYREREKPQVVKVLRDFADDLGLSFGEPFDVVAV